MLWIFSFYERKEKIWPMNLFGSYWHIIVSIELSFCLQFFELISLNLNSLKRYIIYPNLLVFSNLECESIIGTSYTNIFESDGKYLIKYLQIVFNLYFKLLKAFKNSSTHEKYLILENNSYQRLSIIEIEIQIYHW